MNKEFGPCMCGDTQCPSCGSAQGTLECKHQFEEQPGEPPVDICVHCGADRDEVVYDPESGISVRFVKNGETGPLDILTEDDLEDPDEAALCNCEHAKRDHEMVNFTCKKCDCKDFQYKKE